MQIQRMAYVVEFYGNHVPKKLVTMDINLVYVSKKNNYAIFYADAFKGVNQLSKQLKVVKGYKGLSESLLFDPNTNI